jgi:hypothetical protein
MKARSARRAGLVAAVAAVYVAATLLLAAAPPAAGALPSNFKRHQEQFWVWYGPAGWVASSGKNDLNISSPTGTLWNKYGAGGVICPQSAGQWFKALRNNYRDTARAGFGLYSRPLFNARFTAIGGVRQLGDAYFRQTVKWTGRRRGGQQIRGEMIMDVFVVVPDPLFPVCGQRFQVRGAPARGNARSMRLLRTVQSTITSRNL